MEICYKDFLGMSEIRVGILHIQNPLRGYCTSYQKLACFVIYLKIINNALRNSLCIFKKLFKERKNGIEILVGQAVFKL